MATPAVMLGFHPHDSVVFIMVAQSQIRCCVRVDLTWFVDGFTTIVNQLSNALAQVPDAGFVLVGFGEDEDLVVLSMDHLGAALGEQALVQCYLHRVTSYVRLDHEPEEFTFDFDSTKLAAEAVFRGVRIEKDRDAAVAPVLRHHLPPADVELEALCDMAALERDERLLLTQYLAECDASLGGPQAVMLATLLGDPDCAMALFQRLMDLNARRDEAAEVIWSHLTQARAACPMPVLADCLALLAAACWLTGRGAAQTSCLEQLAGMGSNHPLGALIAHLHRSAVSPEQFRAGAVGKESAPSSWEYEGRWARWAGDR